MNTTTASRRVDDRVNNWIDGRLRAGAANYLPVFNPATGEVARRVQLSGDAEIAAAVASSSDAFEAWSQVPSPKRAQVLFAMRELLFQSTDRLAHLIGEEHGKTIADAKGEIQRGIEVVDFACGIPHLLKGEHNVNVGGGIDAFSFREAVGVVLGISPFNFPVMIPLWMGAMAIACGCTFINKPSERDPSSAMLLAELWAEAGLPKGVWNVVHGDRTTVENLIAHEKIDAVSFVGSTPVAQAIYAAASAHGKRVQCFGGAKNHMVLLPDADLDQAADALVAAGYGSAGQRCMAISVAVPVGDETAERLSARLRQKVGELKVGRFDDPDADFGPLVTAEARNRVEDLIASGQAEGADLLVDGRGLTLQGHEEGFFVGPTLFDRVEPQMRIYREEVFGPVLSIVRAADYESAVNLVRANEYGNGVAIFTNDGELVQDFYRRVDVGMIGVNVAVPVPLSFHHFGGSKKSKFGDTQMYGPDAVKFFTKLKTVSQRWAAGEQRNRSLAFGAS
jgi:malonate-semialdehyde dehydrogenase (acetylating) / methylmalonate-semialdehyde dehydrogenase